MLIFLLLVLFTIMAHELGHLIIARLCGVEVEAYSIGFFKPYLHFKWKGIEWRITPFLFGGYVKIPGETSNEKNGLLSQPYYKKAIIVCAGVFVNFLIAFICYIINYGNIFVGMYVDWHLFLSFFTGDFYNLQNLFVTYNPNINILIIGFINFVCGISNLIPFPSLDGSYLWLYLMKPIWKDNYVKYLNYLVSFGFWFLMSFQVFFLLIVWGHYVIG